MLEPGILLYVLQLFPSFCAAHRALADLKNHGVDPDPIFAIGEDTFDLPEDELMKFEQGDSGMSAGFKKAGLNNVDAAGNLDTGE